ncbi:MAG: hypothetical protein ACLQUR_11605 [Limisphaerales bacterium]
MGSLRALLEQRQFSRGGKKMTARFINRLTKRVVERRLLDELAVYNRALSASEIQTICKEENHGEPLRPPQPDSHKTRPFEGINRDFIQP